MRFGSLAAYVLLAWGFLISRPALAEALDGVLGLGYYYNYQIHDEEDGSRGLYRLEFTRISKNITLEARAGSGLGYQDYGGALKGFKFWAMGKNPDLATGVYAGGGVGANWAELGYSQLHGKDNSFTEIYALGFIRYIYDLDYSMGVSVDFEYQNAFLRTFRVGPPKQSSAKRSRFLGGITLMFNVD